MSPARKKRLVRLRSSKKRSKRQWLPKIFLLLGITLVAFLYISLSTNYWDSKTKLAVTYFKEGGDVGVAIFDPTQETITNYTIPGETEVVVARGLGTWKLKSVKKLGENEGLSEKLLAETLIRTFNLPIHAWAEEKFIFISEGGAIKAVESSLTPFRTNLGFGDKIKLALFSGKITNFKRKEIDFSEASAVRKKRLIDGTFGFVPVGKLPEMVLASFSEPNFSKSNLSVQIINKSSNSLIGEEVGRTLQVMGVKVASIKKEEEEESDCEVSGEDELLVKRVVEIFGCKRQKLNTDFDIEIRLGESFAKRY